MIDGFVRIVLGELLDQHSENIGTALVGPRCFRTAFRLPGRVSSGLYHSLFRNCGNHNLTFLV